jgi:hypothetical protein
VLEEAVRAACERKGPPSALPRNIVPFFQDLGSTLSDGEYMLLAVPTEKKAARFDNSVKQWILGWASSTYSDAIDLKGEVRATDLDGMKFTLRTEDGEKVPGRFEPEHEALLLEALGEHASRRVRVVGTGQFAPEDGALKQITQVDRIELIDPSQGQSKGTPIWERLISIGALVSDDDWSAVPADMAANVDHYLYGRKKDRH